MARRRKPAAHLTARNADRHALYEIAVQRPPIMVGFIEDLAEVICTEQPNVLREDFCGTANLASTWVASGDARRAIAVDNDPAVLAWAEQHNRQPLGKGASRLMLLENDVLRTRRRADVLVSLNFSHFIFKHRADLLGYLKHARRCLNDGGFMILDCFGGPDSITPCNDRRRFSDFDYLWQQVSFNPLTNEIDCRIHFRFGNGSTMRDAFVYDWRMWSLPELCEACVDAGFDAEIGVYFESEEGYISDLDAVDRAAWVAYVVAVKN